MLLLKKQLEQMKPLSWEKVKKWQLWKDCILGTPFWKEEHSKKEHRRENMSLVLEILTEADHIKQPVLRNVEWLKRTP